MNCKNCGEHAEGDGYSVVLHCPNAEIEDWPEPDSDFIPCEIESE